MTKTDLTKGIVRNVIGYTTSFTIANLIRRNLDTDSKFQNAEIFVASVAVGSMVAKATQDHVDHEIDEVIALWKSLKDIKKTA
jgi:hypothetical protein